MADRPRSSSISGVMPLLQSDESALGITPLLKEYVKMLCEHPSTWTEFPLEDHLKQKEKSRKTRRRSMEVPSTTKTSSTESSEPPVSTPSTSTSTTSTSTSTEPSVGKSRPRRGDDSPPKMTRSRSKSETAASITSSLRPQPLLEELTPATPASRSSFMSWFNSFLSKEKDEQTTPTPPIPQESLILVKDTDDGWRMTKKQRQHAELLLKQVPQLMGMRQQLVPKHLSEETFWRIYFLLVRNKLGHLLDDDGSDEDEKDGYDRTKPARNASTWTLCHLSSYFQLFSGRPTVTFEGSKTLPISTFYPWWRAHSKGFKDEPQYDNTKLPDMKLKEEEKGRVKGWDTVDLKRLRLELPNQLRKLVREGVPDDHRRMTWTTCVGARELLQHDPAYFEKIMMKVFGEAAPEQCNPIPTFGGSMLYKTRHFLTEEGIRSFKRVLVLLAMTNEYVDYAPLIPDVLAILLSFLPEDEAYVSLQIMIAHSEKQCRFLWLSKRDVFLAVKAFLRLLEHHLPDLWKVIVSCQVRIAEVVEELLSSFFLPWLPYQTVLHLFDCYSWEGAVVLIRVGLGIFSACSQGLMESTTRQEFMHNLGVHMAKLTDSEKLILSSFKAFKLKPSDLAEMYKSLGDTVSQTHMNNSTILHTPTKFETDLSKMITKAMWETIWYWLPHRYQIEDPKLLFTTATDGYNLNTLTNKCGSSKPQLILVKTANQEIFGAFVTEPWPSRPQEHFFGNGESFIFSLYPKETKYSWRLGNRSMFQLRKENSIAVGGGTSGGFGFWLDQELLNGTTEPCETFENEPLVPSSKDFSCVLVEAYTFR